MWLAVVLALAIGVSLGLLGGGGSILTVPMLVYVLGMEAKEAIATSLLVVGVTSLAAMVPHARAGRVDVRVGLAFGAASMAGAYGGSQLSRLVPATVLLVAFAALMLVTGMAMLRGRAETRATAITPSWRRTLVVGAAIGVLTGLVGAGGGFVIVPALALLAGLAMPRAVGTSLLVIGLNALTAFGGSIGHVALDLRVATLLTAAAVVGSVVGAVGAGYVPERALRKGFAWLVLAMAVFMLWRQASPAWAAASVVLIGLGAWALRARASVSGCQGAP